MEPFLIALLAHAASGGTDVVLNHQLIAKIPSRPNAGAEQCLHCARELVFAAIFVALAWFEWHGVAALLIAGLLLTELLISGVDTVIEFDTRTLPVPERVLHYFLFINLGVVITLVGQALLAWGALPTQLLPVTYSWPSWALTVLAAIALAWSVRDGLNVQERRKRGRAQAHPAPAPGQG